MPEGHSPFPEGESKPKSTKLIDNIPNRTLHRGVDEEGRYPNAIEGVVLANPGELVEMDINLLKDGTIAVAHSKELVDQKQEDIENINVEEFSQLPQPKQGESGIEQDENIRPPLFKELFFQAKDRGVKLLMELKGSDDQAVKSLVDALFSLLGDLIKLGSITKDDIESTLSFASFSAEGIEYLNQKIAELNEGVEGKDQYKILTVFTWPSSEKFASDQKVTESDIEYFEKSKLDNPEINWFDAGIKRAKEIGSTVFNVHSSVILNDKNIVEKAEAEGLKVFVWDTALDKPENPGEREQRIQKLIELGVDNVSTERPFSA